MDNIYNNRLISIVLCTVFPIHAFASGIQGGVLEKVALIVFGVPLSLCLGYWIVGKGNRLFYVLTVPIVVSSIMLFLSNLDVSLEAQFFVISVSLIIYALIVKIYKQKKNVPDEIKLYMQQKYVSNGFIHFSCQECGYEAGFIDLKNGLCKSCFEKKLTKLNLTKKSS